MMFKALLLQSWYRLSDSGLEKQLARDLLFRRLIVVIFLNRWQTRARFDVLDRSWREGHC